MQYNNFRTKLIENETGGDFELKFPTLDPTVTGNLQVNVISGSVEVKGEGMFMGAPSEFIPVFAGSSMNFVCTSNNAPTGVKVIKLAPGAIISLVAYD